MHSLSICLQNKDTYCDNHNQIYHPKHHTNTKDLLGKCQYICCYILLVYICKNMHHLQVGVLNVQKCKWFFILFKNLVRVGSSWTFLFMVDYILSHHWRLTKSSQTHIRLVSEPSPYSCHSEWRSLAAGCPNLVWLLPCRELHPPSTHFCINLVHTSLRIFSQFGCVAVLHTSKTTNNWLWLLSIWGEWSHWVLNDVPIGYPNTYGRLFFGSA